nr:hypothetical protein [Tanacetum cinerariifolium]
MTPPTVTSSTDSQMHNNIMAASSRDRPPMLATGRYQQWRSRFLRYIDTRPNGDSLRKCNLSSPYKPTTVVVQAVATTADSLAIIEHTTVETPMNMSSANKAHFESKKEAIHLILTRVGDEIYSTVDACQTTQEMWEAIERLQQGESLNIQDPEWSRFVMIFKQQHKLDEVSYHKLFDILKQYQKKVNELRAERLARNANLLALIATAQANQDPYYQTSKYQKSYAPLSKPSIPTRSHTTTRYKGKEIAKPITPPSKSASKEDNDPEQAQRDKDMQKNLALIAKYFKKIYKPTNNNLRTSSNSRNNNLDTTPRTRLIVESIHIHFDEIKEMSETSVANGTTSLVPQRQKASDYENFDPVPQLQNVSSSADAHVPSQQELDLLFSPLYDEFFTAGSSSVNKSSSPTNNSNQHDTQPTMNIQPTSAPSTPTYVHAKENNDNQAEEEHLQDDEFTHPFCTPVQEVTESSSHNIGNSNVHDFNQPQVSDYRWTKDHPLEQVCRNPSKPV